MFHVPADVHYMRFMKEGKVVRVARVDSSGTCIALYPSEKPDTFYGEAFREVDDVSPRTEIKAKSLRDTVMRNLLTGMPLEKAVKYYEEAGSPNQFFFRRRGSNPYDSRDFDVEKILAKSRVFEVSEKEEK